MNEHRHITERGITEHGGIIFVFDDGSHSYLSPEDTQELINDYLILINSVNIDELPFKD